MVNNFLTVEFSYRDFYILSSTRVGRGRNGESIGVLAFLFNSCVDIQNDEGGKVFQSSGGSPLLMAIFIVRSILLRICTAFDVG